MNQRNSQTVRRLGILAAICCTALTFWCSGAALGQSRADSAIAEQPILTQRVASPEDAALMLREHAGNVCVYQGSLLLYETDIPVESLPQADRKLLSGGIKVRNELELQRFLEDFGA